MITLKSSLYDKVYWIQEKWMCSYCHVIKYQHNNMEQHELLCEYNPKNRNCCTCDYHCDIQPAGGIGCRRWKNIKYERTKKLTHLKNKIKVHGNN